MDLVLREGVVDLVGEHAGRETGDDLVRLGDARGVEHVVVDQRVVPEERRLQQVVVGVLVSPWKRLTLRSRLANRPPTDASQTTTREEIDTHREQRGG